MKKITILFTALFTIFLIVGLDKASAEENFTYEKVGDVVTSVIISEKVTEISPYEFSEYPDIETVYYNAIECKQVEAYDYKQGYIGIFENCPKIKNIIIGEEVKLIPDRVFENLSGVTP